MTFRYVLAWIPMVFLAILNGTVREFTYGPFLSDLHAEQVSGLMLILLFAVYVAWLNRKWAIASAQQAWLIGMIWLLLTVAFEFLFGRFMVGDSWQELIANYDLRAGRLWILVLVAVAVLPWNVYKLSSRHVPKHRADG